MNSILHIYPGRFFNALLITIACGLIGPTYSAVTIHPIGQYATGIFGESAAEIPAYDPASKRLFVVNALAAQVDVLNLHNPESPVKINAIDVQAYGAGVNSVALSDGLLAIAVENAVKTDPGLVLFVQANSLQVLNAVPVGALPDHVIFTPDGTRVLTANEGEPSDDYLTDPEGSVSIIDISLGVENASVRTADFRAFNDLPLEASIRIFGPNASVAQDLEPEYIAISADSTTAWATLQENNALAIIDISSATVTGLKGLGFKDHSLPSNGLDASDRDGIINIAPWPVLGMYQPDSIAAFSSAGQTFLVMANEGDSRDYSGFSEEARVKDLILDKKVFKKMDADFLQNNAAIGRLKTTLANGDIDGDGDHDQIFSFGARSFSIRDATGQLVYDSGDDFEQITAFVHPENFNASNSNNTFDNRSDDKGPEPEGLTVGQAFDRTLAFIGLERIGGIMIYDVSDPAQAKFEDYVNNRNFAAEPETPEAGDLGPEGLVFIKAAESPNGKPLLVVGNEVSGTTTIYEVVLVP